MPTSPQSMRAMWRTQLAGRRHLRQMQGGGQIDFLSPASDRSAREHVGESDFVDQGNVDDLLARYEQGQTLWADRAGHDSSELRRLVGSPEGALGIQADA